MAQENCLLLATEHLYLTKLYTSENQQLCIVNMEDRKSNFEQKRPSHHIHFNHDGTKCQKGA